MNSRCAIVVLALVAASASTASAQLSVEVNSYVDAFLERVLHDTRSSEPISDVSADADVKVLFVNVKAKVDATDGWLDDCHKLRRFSDAILTVNADNKLAIDVTLGFDAVTARYAYTSKLDKMRGPSGNFSATQGTTSMKLAMSFDFSSSACILKFDSVEMVDIGEITMHATGLWLANPIFSKLLTNIAEKQRDKVTTYYQNLIQEMVAEGIMDCNSFLPSPLAPVSDNYFNLAKPLSTH